MKRDAAAIGADVAALSADDFDEMKPNARGMERLADLCDQLRTSCPVNEVAPVLLGLVERLEHVHLGSPGPVVHTLEAMPGYEPFLQESFRRHPTSLTAWMVNRIANARLPDWEQWVRLLEDGASHPTASEVVREEARHFVRRQRGA